MQVFPLRLSLSQPNEFIQPAQPNELIQLARLLISMLLVRQRMRFPFHELSILLPIALTPIHRQSLLTRPRFFAAQLGYIVAAHKPHALVLLRQVVRFFVVQVHIRMLVLRPAFVALARMQVFPLQLLQSLLSGFAQKVRLLIFMLLVVQHKPFTFHELVTLQPACLATTRRQFSFVQPGFFATLSK